MCSDCDDQLGALLVGQQERDVFADSRSRDELVFEPEPFGALRTRGGAVRIRMNQQLRTGPQGAVGD